jgi:mRNA interferase MazF
MPTHVDIVCRQKSTALCEQITTVSKDRIGDFIKSCTMSEMQRIDEALMKSLGIVSDPGCYESEPQRKIPIGFHSEEKPTSSDSVTVERDLYKKLYEQLLDKITG